MIVFNRNNTTRGELFNKIEVNMKSGSAKRVLFYPEGTRLTYNVLAGKDDIKEKLTFGLLKSIYEHKLPVQLCITSNKERVVNEKTVTHCLHKGIHLGKS